MREAVHNSNKNTYVFHKDGHKIALVPLSQSGGDFDVQGPLRIKTILEDSCKEVCNEEVKARDPIPHGKPTRVEEVIFGKNETVLTCANGDLIEIGAVQPILEGTLSSTFYSSIIANTCMNECAKEVSKGQDFSYEELERMKANYRGMEHISVECPNNKMAALIERSCLNKDEIEEVGI